jgi:hypothetical protein
MRSVARGMLPLALSIADNEGDTVKIKGFVSLDVVDRQGEVAPPDEFDIEKFMAAPSILVDHEPWRDSRGNPVSAGYPESIHVVTVKKNREDSSVYNVYDEKQKKVITTYPKSKLPDISPGTRGLFVFLNITDPDVASRVRRGEYAGISWVGMTQEAYRLNQKTQKVEKILTDIDLMEISITVHGPAVPQANFIISGKTAYALRLDPLQYPTERAAQAFAADHGYESNAVANINGIFFIRSGDSSGFDLDKAEAIKCALGCTALVAPQKSETVEVLKEQAKQLASKSQETGRMSDATDTKTPEDGGLDPKVMDALQAVAKSSAALTEKFDLFVDAQKKTDEQISSAVSSIEELTKKTAALEERLTQYETAKAEAGSTEEPAKKTETAEGTADETTEEPVEVVASIKTAFKEASEEFAKTLRELVPAGVDRDETLAQKTATGDKNAVFNTLFGIDN